MHHDQWAESRVRECRFAGGAQQNKPTHNPSGKCERKTRDWK